MDVGTSRGAIADDDFTGYLLHADPAWLANILHLQRPPVYWGKTPEPSSLAIKEGTTLFFRKSREMPAVIMGYAKIASLTKAVPLEEAFRPVHTRIRVQRKRAEGPQDGPSADSAQTVPNEVSRKRPNKADCHQARNGKSSLGAHCRGEQDHEKARDGQPKVFGQHRREHHRIAVGVKDVVHRFQLVHR